jgi:hypothetical protein
MLLWNAWLVKIAILKIGEVAAKTPGTRSSDGSTKPQAFSSPEAKL